MKSHPGRTALLWKAYASTGDRERALFLALACPHVTLEEARPVWVRVQEAHDGPSPYAASRIMDELLELEEERKTQEAGP